MEPEVMLEELNKKFEAVHTDLAAAQEKGDTTAEELKTLNEAVKTQGIALQSFIDAQTKAVVQTVGKQLHDFLNENEEKIKAMKEAGSGQIEFIPKAVAPMTTASGTDVAPVMNQIGHTELGSFNLRNDDALINLATVSSTGKATMSYTELVPKDGDYAFVAEGTEKSQIDWKWENRFPRPYKVAAYEILTEEAVTDVARLESVAKEYLVKKHGLFKANHLYFGTGVGENPEGATVVGRAFVAGGMALKVQSPKFMDAVNACVTDIFTTHNYVDESSYVANVCLINPVDFMLQLVAAKDSQDRALYPNASLFNQVTMGGVTIRPWAKVPAGKIFIADMKQMHVVNYIPFSIRIGWINDQFITNMFTMVGESRYFQYVKNLDRQAFIYDDIDTILTAITKP